MKMHRNEFIGATLVDMYRVGRSQGLEFDTINAYREAYEAMPSCKQYIGRELGKYSACMRHKQDTALQMVSDKLEEAILERCT